MSTPTHQCQGIVIKKTKLGESDLIITFLNSSGEKSQAIAKGARKPQSSFSSRLELCSYAKCLIADTKNLGIIKEAQLINGFMKLRADYDCQLRISCILDIANKLSIENLPNEKLFALTLSVLGHLESNPEGADVFTSAYALKAFAFCGIKPVLPVCVHCGNTITKTGVQDEQIWVSLAEGGSICSMCPPGASSLKISVERLKWMEVLMHSTFDEIASYDCDPFTSFVIMQFCQEWLKYHIGSSSKAIHYYLSEYHDE